MNIVEMLLKLLGGGVGKQLAGLLGIGEDKVEAALKAALPTLLAALGGAASSKEGAKKLASAVEGADDGILGNLSNVLGSQGTDLANKGSSVLGSLLPGGTLGNLSSILGKFTGSGAGTMTTLLGSLVPIVLGLLKRETKSTGFDPASITKLFEGQKENIAGALPAGLGSMLGSIPGLGNLASLAQGARETVSGATSRAAVGAKSAASEGLGAAKWVVPLLLALAVGFLAWNYWPKPQEKEPLVNRAASLPTTVTSARISDEIARQVTSVSASTKDIFADATDALTNVTDAESAEKAAAELPELTDRLSQLKEAADAIPDAQRKPILATIEQLSSKLQALIDKIMKIPGVSTILAPHVNKLKEVLDAFSE